MSTTTRNILTFVIGVIVVLAVANWVFRTILHLVIMLLPIVIVAGALYIGYQAFGRKALGGGRRTLP
jgi:predicted RND superfamily exporter protein